MLILAALSLSTYKMVLKLLTGSGYVKNTDKYQLRFPYCPLGICTEHTPVQGTWCGEVISSRKAPQSLASVSQERVGMGKQFWLVYNESYTHITDLGNKMFQFTLDCELLMLLLHLQFGAFPSPNWVPDDARETPDSIFLAGVLQCGEASNKGCSPGVRWHCGHKFSMHKQWRGWNSSPLPQNSEKNSMSWNLQSLHCPICVIASKGDWGPCTECDSTQYYDMLHQSKFKAFCNLFCTLKQAHCQS